ncbi:fibronectin type III domain-containing protein [Actinoplanes sp. TFC3]|uniref:fibronectin type III domain-containing protein n=1 Tax=Actinoplanes sp. TFC3 TaxID=1710355 RepID=UPI000829D3AE|nr:fibronectin type III domain-containing protein [Actinoplanes sp. TFC3]
MALTLGLTWSAFAGPALADSISPPPPLYSLDYYAGNGTGEPALQSPLAQPMGTATDSQANRYIVTYGGCHLLKVTPAAGRLSVLAGNPAAPAEVTLLEGNERLKITFLPGSANGDPVTHYEVSANDGDTWQTFATTAGENGTRSGTLSHLVNGTNYPVRVRAVNSVGAGAASPGKHGIPKLSGPTAPESLTAIAGDRSATLSFSAPTDDGGSAITEWEVSVNGGETWRPVTPVTSGQHFKVNLTDLTNAISYEMKLRALNTTGHGLAASVTVVPVTPPPVYVPPVPVPPPPASRSRGSGADPRADRC